MSPSSNNHLFAEGGKNDILYIEKTAINPKTKKTTPPKKNPNPPKKTTTKTPKQNKKPKQTQQTKTKPRKT